MKTREDLKKKIEEVASKIKDALVSKGTYSESLSLQIDVLARDYLVYQKISDQFLYLRALTVTETSREGHKRKKPHPLSTEMRMWADTVRRDLEKLSLNLEDISVDAPDKFKQFMDEFRDDDD